MAVETSVELRRFTFDDVLRMVETGVLDPDARVELYDGVLIRMSPEGIDHFGSGGVWTRLLHEAYRTTGHQVRENATLYLDERSFFEPDFMVFTADDFRWPIPETTILIIEIANTSLAYDLGSKAERYARWGLREYWVLDVPARTLIVHRDPGPDGYGAIQSHADSASVPLPATDTAVLVASVLPPLG